MGDIQNENLQQINTRPNSGVNSAGCDTGRDDGFANIKADAFCEILGQEIDRVRNESAQ